MPMERKIKRLEALKQEAEKATTIEETKRILSHLIEEYVSELKDEQSPPYA